MALRNIIQIGDPTLRKKSFEVTDFGEKTAQLLDDMKETLDKAVENVLRLVYKHAGQKTEQADFAAHDLFAEEIAEAKVVKEKLEKSVIDIGVKCGDGKMYGSVTGKEIADELNKMGYTVDKKQIVMGGPIRSFGTYKITVKMYAEVSSSITVVVE